MIFLRSLGPTTGAICQPGAALGWDAQVRARVRVRVNLELDWCGHAMGAKDGIQKQWSKRHGAAVKRGIKKAKAHKKVVKHAALALRKAPKHEIVQRLFTPKSPEADRQAMTAEATRAD